MIKNVLQTLKKHRGKAATILALAGAHSVSMAGGGLASATSAATDFKTWLFGFIAIAAVIYLLWTGIMVFAEKKSWGDFGSALVGVVVVGGIPALVLWAWSVFA